MVDPPTLDVDVLVVGGGIAGLWLLDALRRGDYAALLVESGALGAGQTICSQGIIHGGLKYTLSGLLTPSAKGVRGMPRLWRECLSGSAEPDLRAARVLSDQCYLWRTDELSSRAGLIGAAHQLASSVKHVERAARPAALAACPGDVFVVDEPVVDVASVLRALADQNRGWVLSVDGENAAAFDCAAPGRVSAVRLRRTGDAAELRIRPGHVVLTAGAGNEALRKQLGLTGSAMQRRPLHQVLARGRLPELFGHCIDGAHTRATITSAVDRHGNRVWHIGGQLAEDGVNWSAEHLIEYAQDELRAILPEVDFRGTEWAAYRVDRAEQKTLGGLRPSGPDVRVEGDVLTAWPTKLAMAPVLAQCVLESLAAPRVGSKGLAAPPDWPTPPVAAWPWETCTAWRGWDQR